MRKFLIAALLFLASTLSFGQDGRTKINYYNHTSTTLRMLINGNAACAGDVMPGGVCTEVVYPGTYHIGATNGKQTTDRVITLEDGGTFDYTLYEQESQIRLTPGLSLVSLLNYGPFNTNAPVQLVRGETEDKKTDQGQPYTSTLWVGSLPNKDTYIVGVANYTFELPTKNLAPAADAFVTAVNGKLLKQENVTISGQPALASVIEAQVDGSTTRFAVVVTIKGSRAFVFAFATSLDVQDTDMNAMKEFFNSAVLN